jgi:hypothetical protein
MNQIIEGKLIKEVTTGKVFPGVFVDYTNGDDSPIRGKVTSIDRERGIASLDIGKKKELPVEVDAIKGSVIQYYVKTDGNKYELMFGDYDRVDESEETVKGYLYFCKSTIHVKSAVEVVDLRVVDANHLNTIADRKGVVINKNPKDNLYEILIASKNLTIRLKRNQIKAIGQSDVKSLFNLYCKCCKR